MSKSTYGKDLYRRLNLESLLSDACPPWTRFAAKRNAAYALLIHHTLTRHFLRVMILVMACLMTMPAFSVSFFVKPDVTQTFKAGVGCHVCSRGFAPFAPGKALSLVTRTLFARHCNLCISA